MTDKYLDKNTVEHIRRSSLNKDNFDKTIKNFTILLNYGKPVQDETDLLNASKSQSDYEKWEAAYVARKDEQKLYKESLLSYPTLTANDKRIVKAWSNPSEAEKSYFGVTASTGLLSYPKVSDEERAKFGLKPSRVR